MAQSVENGPGKRKRPQDTEIQSASVCEKTGIYQLSADAGSDQRQGSV